MSRDPSAHPIVRVLQRLGKEVAKSDPKIAIEILDPRTLWLCLKLAHWDSSSKENVTLSQRTLATACNIGLRRTRNTLRWLAHYSVITVTAPYQPGTVRREKSTITWCRHISYAITGERALKDSELKNFVGYCLNQANRRAECDDWLQGFDTDVDYLDQEPGTAAKRSEPAIESTQAGGVAPAPKTDPWASQRLNSSVLKAEQKKANDYMWRLAGRKFVAGAAFLWNAGQQQNGKPAQMPAWEGEIGHLSPTNQKAYRELTKIFEAEGGARACLAWYVFCGSVPGYDHKGNLTFNPEYPHRQWTSADKQPAHFAKYFNSIMADKDTQAFAKDAEVMNHLVIAFGDQILNMQPRWSKQQAIDYAVATKGGAK